MEDFDVFPECWLSQIPDLDTVPSPKRTKTSSTISPKRRNLSMSLSRPKRKVRKVPLAEVGNVKPTKRFASPVKESTFVEAAKGIVPTNTKQCNAWALRAFECWATQRSEVDPSGLLQSNDADLIAQFMRCFVLEVRKGDGEQYTPGTGNFYTTQ